MYGVGSQNSLLGFRQIPPGAQSISQPYAHTGIRITEYTGDHSARDGGDSVSFAEGELPNQMQ